MEGKEMKIRELLEESIRVKEELRKQGAELEKIERVSKIMIKALKNGKKIILFGNGGSAADAQHIACELAGKFKLERRGLPAIALTTNTSALTAIGNDFGYDKVFSRQVEGMVDRDDVVIGISTSGNSVNVIEGIKAAKEKRAFTVGFTGASGGKLEKVVDVCLKAPSEDTPRIQEVHITVGHIICQLVEEGLFQA
jgi:D-sedoheptulose 7-phosphate isomerase